MTFDHRVKWYITGLKAIFRWIRNFDPLHKQYKHFASRPLMPILKHGWRFQLIQYRYWYGYRYHTDTDTYLKILTDTDTYTGLRTYNDTDTNTYTAYRYWYGVLISVNVLVDSTVSGPYVVASQKLDGNWLQCRHLCQNKKM